MPSSRNGLVCPGPAWEIDDLSSCIRNRYLQFIVPLTACTVSLSLMLFYLANRWILRGALRRLLPPTCRYIRGPKHRWNERSKSMHGRIFAPSRRSLQIALAASELIVILVLLTIRLALPGDLVHSHDGVPTSLASIIFWIYLLVLSLLRIITFSVDKPIFRMLWLHSTFLYFLGWILSLFVLRSAILHQDLQFQQLSTVVESVLAATLFTFVAFTPTYLPNSVASGTSEGTESSPEGRASLFGLATFQWVDSMVWKGYKKTLELGDVWSLSEGDQSSNIWRQFRDLRTAGGLSWNLFRYCQNLLMVQGLWAALLSITTFIPTLLLREILRYVEYPAQTPSNVAWLFVVLTFIAGLVSAATQAQTLWTGQKISLRLKSIAMGEIYQKALKRKAATGSATVLGQAPKVSDPSSSLDTQASVGTIINLMSVDAFNLGEVGANLHMLWVSVPIQVLITLFLLYKVLSLSALVGIVTMVLIVPVNSIIAKRFGRLQMEVMHATDLRIESTNEMIHNIKIIKYFTWEEQCQADVGSKRARELEALRRRLMLWSVASTIWYMAPLLITFLSFLSYTAIEKRDLTPSVAFTSLSLFGLLKVPLDQFTNTIVKVQSSLASVKRIEQFLNEDETSKYHQLEHNSLYSDEVSDVTIGFDKATFSWHSIPNGSSIKPSSSTFMLNDINIKFAIGCLNLVVGPTGSGKSSMLMALLGEMSLRSGKVHLPNNHTPHSTGSRRNHGIAYCAQTPWLLNDSIRANILFTSEWDARRYQDVLTFCALDRDLKALLARDLTIVGERGTLLSGGQKQRISLARAIYSNAEHILLDDCLSAVDSHAAKWIFDRCICGPLVQSRTCILVTHNVALCINKANLVVVLNDGQVVACDSPSAIISSGILGQDLNTFRSEKNPGSHTVEEAISADDTSDGGNTIHRNTHGSSHKILPKDDMGPETKAEGHVKWRVIRNYLAATGGSLFWIALSTVFLAQLVGSVIINVWVREFSNAYSVTKETNDTSITTRSSIVSWENYSASAYRGFISRQLQIFSQGSNASVSKAYYLGIYGLLLCCYLLVTLLRMVLVSKGSLAASRKLHDSLLKSVTRAKFSFFDNTPQGQILNRFSKDIETIDQELAPMALGTIHFVGSVVSILILIAVITPAFLVCAVFIGLIYWAIGKLYINSSRDLKRIESVQRSPLYQHFGETLTGTTTIRAYCKERVFTEQNLAHIDTLNRPFHSIWAVEQWLAFRLDVTGGLIALFAASLAILGVGKVDAGAVGLSLTYAITFSENVLWLVRYHALNQQNFTSAERIQDFVNIEQESQTMPKVPEDWPSKGRVHIVNYTTSYRPDLGPVLKNINLLIEGHEKVGIIGRTGSGKSSLALALLRGLDADEGMITIDDIDIRSVGLKDLRQAVTVVPQDPTLFSGTLRSNLDPPGLHTDEEILDSLRKVQLIETSSTNDQDGDRNGDTCGGRPAAAAEAFFRELGSVLTASGANVSQGQRQLLCLARAILRGSKIIILDEATASIDYHTDLIIQKVLGAIPATNITIAHRLQTIIDFDKVLVLDHGEVVEFGAPSQLLMNKLSTFRAMCEANGNLEELEELARDASAGRAKKDRK